MTEFWRARQSYEHCPQSFEQAPKGTVITLGEIVGGSEPLQVDRGGESRGSESRVASIHRATGQDAEDAATADAERAAGNTSRASGPAWRPGQNCDGRG